MFEFYIHVAYVILPKLCLYRPITVYYGYCTFILYCPSIHPCNACL